MYEDIGCKKGKTKKEVKRRRLDKDTEMLFRSGGGGGYGAIFQESKTKKVVKEM